MINKQNSDFENGFEKSKHIITKLKAFSFDTPKEHDEKDIPCCGWK